MKNFSEDHLPWSVRAIPNKLGRDRARPILLRALAREHDYDYTVQDVVDAAERRGLREVLQYEEIGSAETTWDLAEEGYEYTTFVASSVDDALDEAASNVDRSNYPDEDGTMFIEVSVTCALTGESGSRTVTVDPEEPDCSDGAHDWGEYTVHGHGGGVVFHERCTKCGVVQVTDTWAQNPANGEQGFTSRAYRR